MKYISSPHIKPNSATTDIQYRLIAGFREFLLYLLIVTSPLLNGARHPWSFHGLLAGIILLAIFSLVLQGRTSSSHSPEEYKTGAGTVLFVVFLLLNVISIIPLPSKIVTFLTPGIGNVYHNLATAGFLSPPRIQLALWPSAMRVNFMLLSGYLLAFLVVKDFWRSQERAQIRLIWVIFLSGVLQAAFGLIEYLRESMQILGLINRISKQVVTGSFINPNHFAYYLELSLPLGLALAYIGLTKRKNPDRDHTSSARVGILSFWTLIFLLSFVLVTGIYSLAVSGIFFLPFILFLFPLLILNRRQHKFAWPLVLFILFLFSLSLWAFFRINPAAVFQEVQHANFQTFNGRIYLWHPLKKIMGAGAWLGYGWGSFPRVFAPLKTLAFKDYYVDFLHNDWLELWVSSGAIGWILVASAGLLLWLSAFSRLKKTSSSFEAAVLAGGLTSISMIAVHSLIDFGLRLPALSFLLAIILAIISAIIAPPSRIITTPGKPKQSLRFLLTGIGLMLAPIFAVQQIFLARADYQITQARELTYKKDISPMELKVAENLALAALTVNALDEKAYQVLGEVHFIRSVYAKNLHDLVTTAQEEGIAEGFLRSAITYDPAHFRPYFFLAIISANRFMRDRNPLHQGAAIKLARLALKFDPLNKGAYGFFSDLYGYLGWEREQKEALTMFTALDQSAENQYLKNFPSLSPYLQEAIFQGLDTAWQMQTEDGKFRDPSSLIRKARLLYDQGRQAEAEATLKTARQAIPDDTGIILAQAELSQKSNRLPEAIALLNQYLSLKPPASPSDEEKSNEIRIRDRLAQIYLQAGDVERAAEQWWNIAQKSEQPIPYLIRIGRSYTEHQRFPAAIKIYQTILQITPEDAEVKEFLARAFYLSGNTEAGIKTLRELAESAAGRKDEDRTVSYYLLMAGWFTQRQDPALAAKTLYEAYLLYPQNFKVLKALAYAHSQKGNFWEAISLARQALSVKPDDAEMKKLEENCLDRVGLK